MEGAYADGRVGTIRTEAVEKVEGPWVAWNVDGFAVDYSAALVLAERV